MPRNLGAVKNQRLHPSRGKNSQRSYKDAEFVSVRFNSVRLVFHIYYRRIQMGMKSWQLRRREVPSVFRGKEDAVKQPPRLAPRPHAPSGGSTIDIVWILRPPSTETFVICTKPLTIASERLRCPRGERQPRGRIIKGK